MFLISAAKYLFRVCNQTDLTSCEDCERATALEVTVFNWIEFSCPHIVSSYIHLLNCNYDKNDPSTGRIRGVELQVWGIPVP